MGGVMVLVIALIGLVVVLALVGGAQGRSITTGSGVEFREVTIRGEASWAKVACIPVSGLIIGSPMPGTELTPTAIFSEQLRMAREDQAVVAVLLYIDSPGGSITAADIMYEEIKRFRTETGKPVVACLMDVAASGGYYVAAGCDAIVAHPTTVTGSIGVLVSSYDASGLLEKIGIEDRSVASGEYKQMLSYTTRRTEQERARDMALLRAIVMAMKDRFVTVVDEGRKDLNREQVEALADGRIFTAQQALDHKLIDAIGYEHDAVAGVAKLAKKTNVRLVQYQRPPSVRDLLFGRVQAPEIRLELGDSLLLTRSPMPMYLWSPGAGGPHTAP